MFNLLRIDVVKFYVQVNQQMIELKQTTNENEMKWKKIRNGWNFQITRDVLANN